MSKGRTRILLIAGFVAVVGTVVAIAFFGGAFRRDRPYATRIVYVSPPPVQPVPSIEPTVEPLPTVEPRVEPKTDENRPEATPHASSSEARLLIPVAGVMANELQDTFNDARAEGRVHNAIDIMAPRGTPVLAATDGTILKLFWSERGGNTIYQLGTDGRTVYYYAHLDRYADGLTEGGTVRRGATIGYVGDTGNAGSGNYHLHFAIYIVDDPKRYWDGQPINPYPLLKGVESR
ncbi:MAG: endopeptidase [Pyrinomonas sp.]|uniref:M23 family metallopeptidase n=1 Tax=Pyrinomonas sp. TaxID=2080306 RepID=UPI00332560FF